MATQVQNVHYALSFSTADAYLIWSPLCSRLMPHLVQHRRLTSHYRSYIRTNFGELTYSHAGPGAWNAMPEHIRAEPDIRVFKKLLKTHIFNLAFN